MVDATDCIWTKEQAKSLLVFLIAERERHKKDFTSIEEKIKQLREEHNISDDEYKKCEEEARLFYYF
ncbi:MAG: hypothetical protein DRJ45_03335 [Thermoprotei archaeon]|mgnify:CR=1 FL=1|nr:MAG: hypothetical protein DRJ45_03335 [Thermoprotei archaeon]